MKSLLRNHLLHFSYTPSRTLVVRLQACHFSSSPPPQSRDVRVSVWWDFKNCNVPSGIDPSNVAPAITRAVRANGIKGPLHITAFGDVVQLTKLNRDALASTGVRFIHLPMGKKNSVNILVDIMFWAFENPPPAHLFLISGDRDFACILHRLRMNNYNILLASPENAPTVLFSAATIMWQWSSLLKGENLIGKHFNHPPDGPFGSWYGIFKVPLENERGYADQIPSIATVNARSMNDDSKSFQPVPPQGKTIGEYVDSKSSFPSLVEKHEFQPQNELQKSSVASEKVLDVADNAQLPEIQQPSKENKSFKTKTGSLKTRSRKSSVNDNVKSEDASHKIVEKHTTSGNPCAGNDHTTIENNGIADYELGNFKAKNKYENATKKEADELCGSQYSSPVDDSLVDKRLRGIAETNNKRPTFFSWIRSWWPFWKSNAKSDDLAAQQNKVVSHLDDYKLSELDQTVSHFEEPKLSEQDQNVIRSGKPELFSSDSFWNDLESFILTSKGSLLVSKSKNREDMAHRLQNDGPLVLRSLAQKDVIQLVALLIAEKKWLVEIPSHGANGLRSVFMSRASQSKLQNSFEHDAEKQNLSVSHTRVSATATDAEKQNQSVPHTRVSATATEMKYTLRSRNDILDDLQKLVNEILRDHPEGYNISSLRRLFVDRYGYHLDIQKLGHQKLTSLLQKMPGVKLESTCIFPSVHAVSASDGKPPILKNQITSANRTVLNSELSDSTPRDDNMESPWEEFGSNQSNMESKLSQKAKGLDTPKLPDYEPVVVDYDSSESEGDCSYFTQSEKQGKPKCNEEDSSFWQALDSWHSNKEGEISVNKSGGHLSNTLADILNSSTESTCGTLSKIPVENYRQRSQKSYSFVTDPGLLPDKDRLVDGILNRLKKGDELKNA